MSFSEQQEPGGGCRLPFHGLVPGFNVLDNCEPIAGIDSIASEYLCNQTALGTYAEAIVRVELVKNRADLIRT